MEQHSAVSDTSPLINLAGIGLLDLLPRLYGAVLIPRQVVEEYLIVSLQSVPDLESMPGICVVESVLPDEELPRLGSGEAAAISLAVQMGVSVVLLDERKARRIAVSRGLVPIGTLAVLLRAKMQGAISEISTFITMMQGQNRHLGADLITRVLREAGE